MPRSLRVRRSLGSFVIATSLAFVAGVPISYGQTTSTPGATTSTTSTTTSVSPAGNAASERDENLAVLVLVFGAFLTASVLIYVGLLQKRYYDTSVLLQSRTGVLPQPAFSKAFLTLLKSESPVLIDGPLVVVVGQKTEYKALTDDKLAEATWTFEPADLIKPLDVSKTTSSIAIEAVKKGTLRITATVEGKLPPRTIPVTVIEIPPAETSSLPFVGEGYGSILVAVAILALASVLALMGKLSSDAVATLFGAVAGYIFYRVQQGTRTSKADEKAPPS